MTVNIKGHKIFIASPGGLETERALFKNTIGDYNEIDAIHRGIHFSRLAGNTRSPAEVGRKSSSMTIYANAIILSWSYGTDGDLLPTRMARVNTVPERMRSITSRWTALLIKIAPRVKS